MVFVVRVYYKISLFNVLINISYSIVLLIDSTL